MSSIRLLILGVLLRKQPIHGYDVRRELEIHHADRWANIGYGSIYSALGKMADEGLVIASNSDHSGKQEKQTGRTEYRITEQGRAEFERLLHEYWWELKPTIDPFQIALTFMDRLSPSELRDALRHRADRLRSSALTLGTINSTEQPRHLIESMRLMMAHIETELRWIEEMLGKIERGEFS